MDTRRTGGRRRKRLRWLGEGGGGSDGGGGGRDSGRGGRDDDGYGGGLFGVSERVMDDDDAW